MIVDIRCDDELQMSHRLMNQKTESDHHVLFIISITVNMLLIVFLRISESENFTSMVLNQRRLCLNVPGKEYECLCYELLF